MKGERIWQCFLAGVVLLLCAPRADAQKTCDFQTLEIRNGSLGGFAQTDNYVYWSESDVPPGEARLMRRPKAGGPSELLLTFSGRGAAVAADRPQDGALIYYSRMALVSSGVDEIWRWDPATGVTEMVVTDLDRPIGLLPDPETLVWGDQGMPSLPGVRRLDFATNAITTLASSFYNVRYLSGDHTHVYFATYFGNGKDHVGRVYRTARDGSGFELLADRQPVFGGIASDDAHVYWTTHAFPLFPAPYLSVSRVEKDGANWELLNADVGINAGIAVGGGNVYWLRLGGFGTSLHTMPASGGAPVELAVNQEFFAATFLQFNPVRQTLYFSGDWGSSGTPPHPIAIGSCSL